MSAQEIEDIYPLSPLQQGMLLETLRRPGTGVYVGQLLCRIRGGLDPHTFERAWQEVLARHAILRAGFVWGETPEPLHVIGRGTSRAFTMLDWRTLAPAMLEEQLIQLMAGERARGFDLADPPLMRFTLIHVAKGEWRFLWSHHHLLLDGWSLGIVLHDVRHAYDAFSRNQLLRLPLRRPFRDFIAWLREQDRARAERFWRATLQGLSAPSRLRFEGRQRDHAIATPARAALQVDESVRNALEALARAERVTLNAVLQACWAVLLSRYCGEDTVLFGVTTAGRRSEIDGVDGVVGPFINTVLARVRLEIDCPFTTLAQECQRLGLEQQPFEWVSLADVRRWGALPADEHPFDTLFIFQSYPVAHGTELGGLDVLDVRTREQTEIPLVVVVHPTSHDAARLTVTFESRDARLDEAVLGRVAAHFDTLLHRIVAAPQRRLWDLEMLSARERRLAARRPSSAAFDLGEAPRALGVSHEDVMARFARIVATTPDAPAVIMNGERWSFAQLQSDVHRVAGGLRAGNVGLENLVAVCLERSPALLAAILGVLEVGAAFLVIDPDLPPARRVSLLEDASPAALITSDAMNDRLTVEERRWPILTMSALLSSSPQAPTAQAIITPEAAAYVVYTSGSTGQPKGVMVTRDGLSNYVGWAVEAYRVGEGSGAPWHSSMAFDLSFTSVFCPLLAGRPVTIVPESDGPDGLADLLRRHSGFSFVKLTPAHARALADRLHGDELAGRARRVILGGEALHARDVEAFHAQEDVVVVNEYGPTETVVGCSAAFVHPHDHVEDDVSIGEPISRTELLVLDRHRRLVPLGLPGELFVGGPGVARGYLRRPDLTAEGFVPHPFPVVPGERLYRTGDLVRRRDDESLVYIGRSDAQVKVSGYRIEPRELEQALLSHPAVREAAVIAEEDEAGHRHLVGYVVAGPEAHVSGDALSRHVAALLPRYMVPAEIVALDALPMTSSGKIDRSRLRTERPIERKRDRSRAMPRDRAELELRRVWEDVLGHREIGVTDRFFDLGGDSLKAMHLAGQVRRRLGVDISVAAVLQHPTIEAMAVHLRAQAEDARRASSLVVLRDGKATGPLVLIHPASGNITPYLDLLACIPPGRPVIGFQAQALDGGVLPQGTVEDMAQRYVEELVASKWPVTPELAGWSFGALVAFEMAAQLSERERPPHRLTIIDTPCPSPDSIESPPPLELLLASFARGFGVTSSSRHAPGDSVVDLESALDWIRCEACKSGGLPPAVDSRWVRAWFDVYAGNVRAARRYRPRPYRGHALVILTEANARAGRSLDLGWKRWVEPIVSAIVPGDHHSALKPPHVRVLAAAMAHDKEVTSSPARLDAAMELRS